MNPALRKLLRWIATGITTAIAGLAVTEIMEFIMRKWRSRKNEAGVVFA